MNGAIKGAVFDEPSRVVINTMDSIDVVTAKNDAKLRSGMSKKDDIVADIAKGERLVVIGENGDRTFVYTEDGLMGYVENSKISEATAEAVEKSQGWMDTEKYDYISMDGKVCLGWHQMESAGGNDSLASVLIGVEGLNVI